MHIKLTAHKKTYLGIMAALVAGVSPLGAFLVAPSVHAAAGTTYYVNATAADDTADCLSTGTACKTINGAIAKASAGDTIQVAVGTYAEVVNVNKSLTINGAAAGSDARSRSGSETTLKIPAGQSHAVTVSAPDVTVDGLTIDGADGTASIGIYAYNTASSNLQIVNNVIKNNSNGVDLLGTDSTNLVIKQNLFDNNNTTGAGNGVYIAGTGSHGTNLSIADNTFRNTDDGTAGSTNAILINGTASGDIKEVKITGNSSTNDGSFLYVLNLSKVTVSNNTVSQQVGNGVLIGDNVNTMTISGNTLKDSATGVKFAGATVPATDVTITDNTISGMSTAGVLILDGTIASGVTISGNTITGNKIGLDNQSGVTVDANGNNWGCAAGPGNAGCDSVSGNVDVATWIGQKVPGVPDTGFSPIVGVALLVGTAVVVLGATGFMGYRFSHKNVR